MQPLTITLPQDPDALVKLAECLAECGVTVEGYLDPREHLTLKQAAEEAHRRYDSFYRALMRDGKHLLSRPFGPTGDPRITRGNLWIFLAGNPRGE